MNTRDAIEHYGSASALARALGITPAAVAQWKAAPPYVRQLQLERMTGGALKAQPLRLPVRAA